MARRRRRRKMTMASRYKRRAYGRKRPTRRRRRRNPISRKMAGGLEQYRLTVRKLKAKGLSTKGKLPTLKARLAKASGSNGGRKKSSSAKKRRTTAVSRVASARRALAGAKGKRSVSAQMGVLKARVARAEKALRAAKGRVAQKKRRRKARKNPGHRKNANALHLVGFGLGGFAIEQLLAGGLRKALEKTINEQSEKKKRDMYINAVELGVPTVGSLATYLLHKKGIKILRDQKRMIATIAGMWGGYVARNVDAVTKALVKVPGLGHLAVLGQEDNLSSEVMTEYLKGIGKDKKKALEAYYAGAAGLGRYVTSGSLGGMHDDDDLYAGAAGVGRYMLDDTAFPMAQGASGVGEYIQVPPQMDGLSGSGHDDSEYDELIDELGAVPALTPDEEQAENILIPQLAYEAMQGGMGQVGPEATIKARQPNAAIVRTTPGMAAKVEAYNIGEIIGPSKQVPGTVLVASSVAGRDIFQGAGPFVPTQATAFKNPQIKQAQNIEVSPYGVFSHGIFSSTLPVHGAISR